MLGTTCMIDLHSCSQAVSNQTIKDAMTSCSLDRNICMAALPLVKRSDDVNEAVVGRASIMGVMKVFAAAFPYRGALRGGGVAMLILPRCADFTKVHGYYTYVVLHMLWVQSWECQRLRSRGQAYEMQVCSICGNTTSKLPSCT